VEVTILNGGESLGACPTLAFVARRRGAARCEAAARKAGGVFAGNVEDFFRAETTQMVCGLFAAVEWSMSYRLPGQGQDLLPRLVRRSCLSDEGSQQVFFAGSV